MIALNTLTQQIQNGLNALGDKEFQIFTDVGEFKSSYRAYNSNSIIRYINGIMEAMSPTRLPMRNLEVITQSFRISFVLDVALLNKNDNGDFIEVQEIRELLEKYIKNNNGTPYYLIDSDNKTFEITPTYSGVTVGIASQMSPIGDILPMYLDFSCVFVESGVNTNGVDFYINGENMYFQRYSITRTRTAETNMIANEPSSKTLAQANGISLTLEAPLLGTTQSLEIEEDVWSGTQNEALCIEKVREGKTNAYIMIYGNNSETGNIGQNIGQVVDFIEGKQDELNYSDSWQTLEVTTTTDNQVYSFSPPVDVNEIVLFWGDGTSQHSTIVVDNLLGPREEITHTYKKAGTYTLRYFKYPLPILDLYIFNFYAKLNETQTIGGGTLTKVENNTTNTGLYFTNINQGEDSDIYIKNNVVVLGNGITITANAGTGYNFSNWEETSENTIQPTGFVYNQELEKIVEYRNHDKSYSAFFDKK